MPTNSGSPPIRGTHVVTEPHAEPDEQGGGHGREAARLVDGIAKRVVPTVLSPRLQVAVMLREEEHILINTIF